MCKNFFMKPATKKKQAWIQQGMKKSSYKTRGFSTIQFDKDLAVIPLTLCSSAKSG